MRIGDILVALGYLTEDQRKECVRMLAVRPTTLPKHRLGDLAVINGYIREEKRKEVEECLEKKCHKIAENEHLKHAFDSIASGRAILFAGAGMSIPGPEDSTRSYLTGNKIKSKLVNSNVAASILSPKQVETFKSLALPEVAQWFRSHDNDFLNRTLETLCKTELPDQPLVHHKMLSVLNPFRFIVTTNWDCLIEKAFYSHGEKRPLSVIHQDVDLVKLHLERTSLLKLHGSFVDDRFEHTPLVSTSDFIASRENNPLLYGLLKALFAAYDVVVIGFRPDDYNFSYLKATLSLELGADRTRGVYIIDPDESLVPDSMVSKGHHIPISSSLFLSYLDDYLQHGDGKVGVSWSPPKRFGDSGDTSPVRFWASQLTLIAKELRSKYSLDHVEIVPTKKSDEGQTPDVKTRQSLGKRAARLLSDWTEDDDSICVGGGDTTKWLVSAIDPVRQRRNLNIFAGSIRAFPGLSSLSSTTTLSLLVESLRVNGSHGFVFPIQRIIAEHRILESKGDLQRKIDLSEIQSAVEGYFGEASRCRVCILGIGALNVNRGGFAELAESSLHGLCSGAKDQLRRLHRYVSLLRDAGFVGDVLARPLRTCVNGKCFMEIEDYMEIVSSVSSDDQVCETFFERLYFYCWSLNQAQLQAIAGDSNKQSLMLASGEEKAFAVNAALHARLFSSMVIDEELGLSLLKIKD